MSRSIICVTKYFYAFLYPERYKHKVKAQSEKQIIELAKTI